MKKRFLLTTMVVMVVGIGCSGCGLSGASEIESAVDVGISNEEVVDVSEEAILPTENMTGELIPENEESVEAESSAETTESSLVGNESESSEVSESTEVTEEPEVSEEPVAEETTETAPEPTTEAKITQEEYDEYYPYDGLEDSYYSVFVETDLNKASTISGSPLVSEEGIADYIAGMLALETGPYFAISYAGIYEGTNGNFYEFRCHR